MIYRHLLIDAEGWMRGTLLREGPRLPAGSVEMVPLTPSDYEHASCITGLRHGPDGLELPQDDRVAWRRLRHGPVTGLEARAALEALRGRRAIFPRDVTIAVPNPPPRMALGAPIGHQFPEAPGLTLEAMHVGHLDEAAAIAIASNLVPATCPPECGRCQPPEAHGWLELAARLDNDEQWQFCLTFQGRPLQYEVITFDPQRTTATFAITYHTTAGSERSAWFHREVEQPVYAALQQLGIRTLDSRTRSDRPDWIAALKANYGAVERGQIGPITRLEFPLDLSRFQGWPTRTTLGHDVTSGRIRQREATAADLPTLKAWAVAAMPPDRAPVVLRMIDEWWHLDQATILLGYRDGELRYARGMRHRKPGNVSSANLGPMYDDAELELLAESMKTWCRAAGYQTLTTYVPKRFLALPRVQAKLARFPTRTVREKPDPKQEERDGFVELEMTL